MDALRFISLSVTPVVLISACGLITLALYNRLGTILARIRDLHRQKIQLIERLEPSTDGRPPGDEELLLELLDAQVGAVTVKAKTVQRGLFCLLAAVLAFLLCSLLAAASGLHDLVGALALSMHVVGLALAAAGIGWAIRELTLSISPLEEESAFLAELTERRLASVRLQRPSGLNRAA